MNYYNKTVVITGGAKGIGKATAKLFFDEGANVVVLDVAKDSSNINDKRSMFLHCDVSNETEVKNAFENIRQRFGSIDFLVNNAGIQRYGTV
ncbi:MAG: SDR family NAD(P)-dependent oxidoreductase, partial [Parafilimonas sp.]|nr:SDR family NAD(P)-dependent oxidoreductase [Parafilimonas sp.]